MKKLVNILYFVLFLGFLDSIIAFLLGCLMMLTVIGIPLGQGLWQAARFFTNPMKYKLVTREKKKANEHELWRLFGMFLWIIYFPLALLLTLLTLVQSGLLLLSWVGRPLARKFLSSLGSVFYPVDRIAVSIQDK